MKIQRAVAIRLSKLMLEKNITQYRLSKKMLVPQNTIKHIINEEYSSIKFHTMIKIKIADAFEMTVQEFLDDPVFDRDNLDVD